MRDNIETNYLIFVSSDGKKAGLDIFNARIEQNKWPIYNKTAVRLRKDIIISRTLTCTKILKNQLTLKILPTNGEEFM